MIFTEMMKIGRLGWNCLLRYVPALIGVVTLGVRWITTTTFWWKQLSVRQSKIK